MPERVPRWMRSLHYSTLVALVRSKSTPAHNQLDRTPLFPAKLFWLHSRSRQLPSAHPSMVSQLPTRSLLAPLATLVQLPGLGWLLAVVQRLWIVQSEPLLVSISFFRQRQSIAAIRLAFLPLRSRIHRYSWVSINTNRRK